MKIAIMFILFSLTSPFSLSKSACIIVHGTWASKAKWHQPGGSFYENILCSAKKRGIDDVVSFFWSGKNSNKKRNNAAIGLCQLILQYDSVVIVAHSHGATVGIIASHILYDQWRETGYKIKKFYALGVPVNKYDHFPNMHVIEKFYNLFSFADDVQPVFGIFGRTFFLHDRVANLSIQINGKEPNHSQIHHEIVGRDLLGIDECFSQKTTKRSRRLQSDSFSFVHPGKLYFFDEVEPQYEYDYQREELIAQDEKFMRLMMDEIMRERRRNN